MIKDNKKSRIQNNRLGINKRKIVYLIITVCILFVVTCVLLIVKNFKNKKRMNYSIDFTVLDNNKDFETNDSDESFLADKNDIEEKLVNNTEYFDGLSEDEKFHVSVQDNNLKLTDNTGRLVFEKSNVLWGNWQISKDYRKVILFSDLESEYPYKENVFLVDGNKGVCRFLAKNWSNAMSDVSMKYILWQNDYFDLLNLSLFDIESGAWEPVKLNIDNSERLKKGIYTISIYRSQIDEFDFIVKICYDNLIAAKYGLSAIAKDFKKIFDATSEPESKYISSENTTDYEIGWQPCK